MGLSENTQNPGLAVDSNDALRSLPIAALDSGERASAAGVLYRLDKASFLPDDDVNVIAARPAVVSFAPLVVNPLIPGRWRIETSPAPPGSGGINTDYQAVIANGQTVFNLPALPTTDVVMQVNGVTYPEGTSWTRVGLVVTWLDVPFLLAIGDEVTFLY